MTKMEVKGWTPIFKESIKNVLRSDSFLTQIGFAGKINTIFIPQKRNYLDLDEIVRTLPTFGTNIRSGFTDALENYQNINPLFVKRIKTYNVDNMQIASKLLESPFSVISIVRGRFNVVFRDDTTWNGIITFLLKYRYLTSSTTGIVIDIEGDE